MPLPRGAKPTAEAMSVATRRLLWAEADAADVPALAAGAAPEDGTEELVRGAGGIMDGNGVFSADGHVVQEPHAGFRNISGKRRQMLRAPAKRDGLKEGKAGLSTEILRRLVFGLFNQAFDSRPQVCLVMKGRCHGGW